MDRGFTLAEVLIALVIIGVIAAVTVPVMVANWHKEQTLSLLKKAYSTLSQTTYRAIADNGPIHSWEISGITAKNFSDLYLKPYLHISNNNSSNTFDYIALNGQLASKTSNSVFYLADGMKLAVQTPLDHQYGREVQIYVDINGDRKPNRMGRDIFTFNYWVYHSTTPEMSGKFVLWGSDWSRENIKNSSASYACNKNKTGDICGALIVKDGWQISNDYPW